MVDCFITRPTKRKQKKKKIGSENKQTEKGSSTTLTVSDEGKGKENYSTPY